MGYGWGTGGCTEYCWIPNCLDPAILGDILAGGADKVKEAGAVLVGGHSVQDDEPKYGLCVSGLYIQTRYSRTMDADRETFLY